MVSRLEKAQAGANTVDIFLLSSTTGDRAAKN